MSRSGNRTALVTGGSRGIGRAVSLDLAGRGFAVAVNYVTDVEEAKATVALIENAGGEAIGVQADVGDRLEVERMFTEVEDAFGSVTVLVNNAGLRRDGLALRMSDPDWDDVIATNLTGPFLCSRRVLRAMLKARFGRIVNVSSVAGLHGNPGQANYCAAKAGLLGLTRSLARELAGKNVTVNAVAPGLIETELTTSLPPQRYAELVHEIPAGRAGSPEDVAGVVGFLCSDEASYINGSVFVVDGAMTA